MVSSSDSDKPNEPPKSKAKVAPPQPAAAAASSSSSSSSAAVAPAKAKAAAAAAPAKAKAAGPITILIGTPPRPTTKIPQYVLDSELASAYHQGLITDPEDLEAYEELMDDKSYRKEHKFKKPTKQFTNLTKLRLYRGIYDKIKDR